MLEAIPQVLERSPHATFDFVGSFLDRLTTHQVAQLRKQVVDRTHEVAKIAGGFLGIASISSDEEKTLARIEAAFKVS